MARLSLDPVPILETRELDFLSFRDNVQLNYNKIQDVVNIVAGHFDDLGRGLVQGLTSYNGIELYHPTSNPFIDFHNAANPAGDSGADYDWRFIRNTDHMALQKLGATFFSSGAFRFYTDGEFDCNHIGVGGDNTLNSGIYCGGGDLNVRDINFVGQSGAFGSDYAQFAHWNQRAASDGFGFLQRSTGQVYIAAATGTAIELRINNTTKFSVVSDGSLHGVASGATIAEGRGGSPLLSGGAGNPNFIFHAGTIVFNFVAGNATFTFPVAYTNIWSVIVCEGGGTANIVVGTSSGTVTGSNIGVYAVFGNTGAGINGFVRVNYIILAS